MSTRSEKKLEKTFKLLERLAKEATKGIPIIVEGRNDINTLHELGIEGDIISPNSKDIANKEFFVR